jgi:hypothetical protein
MCAAASPERRSNSSSREPMPVPDVIPVRRTEEDAGYVSFRPVVRQNFPLNELLGLVLGVTGKQPDRVRQILRSGSVSFHSFHYSWEGFQPEEEELASLLARFPDSDPLRVFRAEACTVVLVEGGAPPRLLLDLERAAVDRKRLLRRRSFWGALLSAAAQGPLAYGGYSYQWRADIYRLLLEEKRSAALSATAQSLAPRDMRRHLRAFDRASQISFICPRGAA